jgi:2-polyprenyl-3-methyl-5-hydroxy-6-metoxy-1,4-benzoquinol methylase
MRMRSTERELMDLDSCDPVLYARTVQQYALINRLFSASRRLISRLLLRTMETRPSMSYTLLDLGAGGCDIDIWLIKKARQKRLSLSVTAIDHDERVLAAAREATKAYPEITVLKSDVRNIAALGNFNFIFCNHLLHHLTWDEIGCVLQSVERQANLAFLLNDIRRSWLAYAGYSLFTALFLKRSLAFADGRLSIRKGFKEKELRDCISTFLPGTRVKILKAFPARLALYSCKI